MDIKHKTYRLVFSEYHDEIETTDKRITISVQTSYIPGLMAVDQDALVKEKILEEFKQKLGL